MTTLFLWLQICYGRNGLALNLLSTSIASFC